MPDVDQYDDLKRENRRLRSALEALDAVLDFSEPVISGGGFQFMNGDATDFNKAIAQARAALEP